MNKKVNKKVNKKEFIERLTACRTGYDSEQFKQDVQDLDRLLKEERERCAKIADEYKNGIVESEQNMYATIIAKAIRK